jgi:hypothetical protein
LRTDALHDLHEIINALRKKRIQVFGLGIFEIVVLLLILFILIGIPATIIAVIFMVTRTANVRSDEETRRE